MNKIRYELDPHNRLIVNGIDRRTGVMKFRTVLDGEFKLDKGNNLIYHAKVPAGLNDTVPSQLKLRGEWAMTKNHDLKFTFEKWHDEFSADGITINGEIADIKKNELSFLVTAKRKKGVHTYMLHLAGAWSVDDNNRVLFSIKRESGENDAIIFSAAWDMDKNNEIIYEYMKSYLTKGIRKKHILTFKGKWQVQDNRFISYELTGDSESSFNFKTEHCVFKENYIRYRLGIMTALRAKPVKREITLYGQWKIIRNVGLVFEIDCGKNGIQSLTFGGEVALLKNNLISFKIVNDKGEKDISGVFTLSHKFLKGDGQAFLKLLKSKEEKAVFVGAGFRW